MITISLSLLTILWSCGTPDVVDEPNGDGASGSAGLTDSGGGSGGIVDTSDSGGSGGDGSVVDTSDGTGEEGSGDEGGSDTGQDTGGGGSSPVMMANFQLEDLNPASPRYGDTVSPRDYMAEVSGWYFIIGS